MIKSNKALARLIAVLLAFALVAAACGGDDDDAADEEGTETTDDGTGGDEPTDEGTDDGGEEEPADDDGAIVTEAPDDDPAEAAQGGTLRVGLEADVDGLNPVTSALSNPGMIMVGAALDSLTLYNEDDVAVPYLAESFTPNDDFTSWTMKLREGITFHDGTPLDSEAIRVNFETVIADPLVGLAVKPFYPPVDEGALEIVDDLTVTYNLLEADAYFPAALAGQLGFVASPTWLAAALEDPTLNQQPVGTGPFVFESRSEDSITRFVRNDDYWNGEVYLDAVEFVPVTDGDVMASLLLEGELDTLATTNVGAIDTLAGAGDDKVINILDDSGEESFAQLNTSVPPFDDIRARQALTYSTRANDYQTLIQLGVTREASQFFSPDSPYHNPDIQRQSDQPELAQPLVDEYCAEFADNCSGGKINMELQWSGPSVVQSRIADLLIEGWDPFFNVERQELLQDQHIQETAFGQYNVVTWRTFGSPEPSKDEVWISCKTIGGISLNWVKFCDEERDAIWAQARVSLDPAERAALYQEWSANVSEDFLYVFFNHTLWDNAITPNVKGLCDVKTPEGEPLRCTVNGRVWFQTTFMSE